MSEVEARPFSFASQIAPSRSLGVIFLCMYALLYFFHSKIIAINNYYMEGFIILKNDYFRPRIFFCGNVK